MFTKGTLFDEEWIMRSHIRSGKIEREEMKNER